MATDFLHATDPVAFAEERIGFKPDALQADRLQSSTVRLNGEPLELGAHDDLPRLAARTAPAGLLRLPPASITFLVMRDAAVCR